MARYGTTAQSPKYPAAPEIQITVSAPGHLASLTMTAIPDTAAAMTCLPLWAAREFQQHGLSYRWTRVRGPVGESREMPLVSIRLKILQCEFDNYEVGVIDRQYALIGRDILNLHTITFEGNKRWMFHPAKT